MDLKIRNKRGYKTQYATHRHTCEPNLNIPKKKIEIQISHYSEKKKYD